MLCYVQSYFHKSMPEIVSLSRSIGYCTAGTDFLSCWTLCKMLIRVHEMTFDIVTLHVLKKPHSTMLWKQNSSQGTDYLYNFRSR